MPHLLKHKFLQPTPSKPFTRSRWASGEWPSPLLHSGGPPAKMCVLQRTVRACEKRRCQELRHQECLCNKRCWLTPAPLLGPNPKPHHDLIGAWGILNTFHYSNPSCSDIFLPLQLLHSPWPSNHILSASAFLL